MLLCRRTEQLAKILSTELEMFPSCRELLISVNTTFAHCYGIFSMNMWQKIRARLPKSFRGQDPINAVAVVKLNGVIAAPAGRPIPVAGARISLNSHEETLKRAFELPGLRAIALVINSPGGSPTQSSLLFQRIRTLRERANNERGREYPILAFVEDVAASGGYFLACAADQIFADANSIVGSVGVVSQSFGIQHMAERVGLESRLFTAGEHKVRNHPFRPLQPADEARIRELMGITHENFKAVVRASRGARLKGSDKQLFEGDAFLGSEAVANGLIDGIGELEGTCRAQFGEDTRFLVVQPPRKGFLETLAAGPFGGTGADATAAYGQLSHVAQAGASFSANGGPAAASAIGYDLLDGALQRLYEERAWDAAGAHHVRW